VNAGAKPGEGAGRTASGTASGSGAASGSGPRGAATAPPGATAYAPPSGSSTQPGSSGALDRLNSRLNGLLPSGNPVTYSNKHYQNDLGAAVAQAEEEYYRAAAPPPAILAKAIDVVKQRGSLLGPPTIVYILKRQKILGIEICTGWQIESTASGPQGGYTFGPCSGEAFTPAGGLPTLPPKRPEP